MPLLPIPEDRAEWLRLRLGFIGGADIGCFYPTLKASWQASVFALWHQKTGRVQANFADNNERVLAGQFLEPAIAKLAAHQNNWRIQPGMFAVNDKIKGSASTLDFIIEEPAMEELRLGFTGPGVLQIKNVDGRHHHQHWGDEPPEYVVLQVHKEMWDANLQWGCVAALVGGNHIEVYRYGRNDETAELEADMARRITAFWASVEADVEPPVDGSDSSREALQALYPVLREAPLDLSSHPGVEDILQRYRAGKEQEKAGATVKDLAANQLRHLMGECRKATLPGGASVSVSVTPAKPDVVIDASMVGTTLPGRKEARRLNIKEPT